MQSAPTVHYPDKIRLRVPRGLEAQGVQLCEAQVRTDTAIQDRLK